MASFFSRFPCQNSPCCIRLRVWPGSHRPRRVLPHSSHSDPRFDTALLADMGPNHTEAEAVPVPMQLGDVLVFDGAPHSCLPVTVPSSFGWNCSPFRACCKYLHHTYGRTGFLLHQSFANRANSGRFRRALTQQYTGDLVNVGSNESYQPSVHQRTAVDAKRQREGAKQWGEDREIFLATQLRPKL